MTLKRKIAFNFSIAYSIIFAVVMAIIYYASYDFRKEEFLERLRDKLDFTLHNILKNENFDAEGANLEIEEPEDELFHDEVLIFNSQKKLIYSTVKDKKITWDQGLLEELDETGEVHIQHGDMELLGAIGQIRDKEYYIFVTAQDRTGRVKLEFLRLVLIIVYLVTTVFVWIFSYNFVKKLLTPLDKFTRQITEITAHKLTTKLEENKSEDEISVLARAFNTMMVRINDVFQSQKDFTASASHEIRTPLTRITFQLENLSNKSDISPETRTTLQKATKDIYQLSDLTSSLILLTKFDRENIQQIFKEERIDEVIFDAYEAVLKNYPHLQLDFKIDENTEPTLTVNGIKPLLEIVFINLFKNAALYSDNAGVNVFIRETAYELHVMLENNGPVISDEDQKKLFEAFMRGQNSQNISGSGLGLKIVQRILEYHKAQISYEAVSGNRNVFTIIFPTHSIKSKF
ncbi:HAMP domain-containing histidine kinase [Elizabethkingia meningoseptica]|uniref:histidine kinase n=1 Tax=Elizabethkingia meningoseptica TaxID=238 RepID=A0A1V3U1L5_ELIME|nr:MULTISPECIES: ATP-binding protein [Elizabethkingia]AQX13317.1 two-component sensor histidine kinase [Elizabethkingia meningoseptica]EJK5327801.1 HAMP domain-containing protein [Elizabethkingia meningoseptica]MBG0514950.1 HAMP domain-containing protein [Elizabethkingia meningoseptica]MDE5429392.1 HAMP domain-containing histidine kinase [Elizabethkingia meningoseptica]MDE5434551.1 HAMP domain-containing histidine kinase [Elizabethkingia meningoseptica]